ncbi:MAG: glycosyltransferase family 39 protein [Chloroflexi bacterium]|nr:glycosyltransferase family 39 protein [Chloroflexota bacterium]
MARRLLIPLIILQALTHLFWLTTSVHSGQVAIPWLMNNGMRLFDDILEQHAPGSSLLGAAAQQLLPFDPAHLIRLLNTVLVVAFTLLIYLLAKRLANSAAAGILAALVWAWWEPVYGNVMLYFDSLLALCLSAAMLVYFADSERPSPRRVIMIGLLMGAATLFKQQAWLALGVMLLWLILVERRRESAPVFVGAALLLPLLQWIWLLAQGSLSSYIYWNWTFNLSGLMDGAPLDGDLVRKLLLGNLLVFPFALLAWREARRQTLLVLIWLASLSVLYPRFGEIHAMGHLPLTAVMSGVVLAKVGPTLKNWRSRDMTNVMLAGLAFGIGLGWLWTGAASYLHLPLGPGATLGYDEFSQLAPELNERKTTGDTLFVLPETDSTPQLHTLTDMPPPGVWVKGWHWYFRGEGVLNRLKEEWAEKAPTWIVVFPDLILNREIGIGDLLAIVAERYQLVAEVDGIYGHGPAEIYTLKNSSE